MSVVQELHDLDLDRAFNQAGRMTEICQPESDCHASYHRGA